MSTLRRRDVRRRARWFAVGAALSPPFVAVLVLAGRYPMPAVGIATVVSAIASVAFNAAQFWRDLPP
jgi:hypothetical protein